MKNIWACDWLSVLVFDLSAKLQSGVLSGNHQNPGDFLECVSFKHGTEVHKFEGQHCMVFFVAIPNSTDKDSELSFGWKDL